MRDIVRQIGQDELDAYASFGSDAELTERLRAHLAGAEWWFVAEERDEVVGRLVFSSIASAGARAIEFLDLDWDGDRVGIGRQLVGRAVALAGFPDETALEYILDEPHPLHRRPKERAELLEALGFVLVRETDRWQLAGGQAPGRPPRLRFRSVEEVGEDVFVGALRDSAGGGKDRQLERRRGRLGVDAEARDHFALLAGLAPEADWLEVAFDEMDELVGVIAPAQTGSHPIIAYVGVVPEKRGHAYVDDLLARGTQRLIAAGAHVIRSDSDVLNVPMADAFRRGGYDVFARRCEYELDAPGVRALAVSS